MLCCSSWWYLPQTVLLTKIVKRELSTRLILGTYAWSVCGVALLKGCVWVLLFIPSNRTVLFHCFGVVCTAHVFCLQMSVFFLLFLLTIFFSLTFIAFYFMFFFFSSFREF